MCTLFFYIDDDTFRLLISTHVLDVFTFFIFDTVSMFAVNHDRESGSEEIKVGNLPHTVIEWSLNQEGSLNHLAARLRQLRISFGHLSGRMLSVPGGLGR